MKHSEQAENFLKVINSHYDEYKGKWQKFSYQNHIDWDDDVFQDTIIKVYEKIMENGITDETNEGYLNYLFKSLVINLKREKQYSRNAYRNKEVDVLEHNDKKTNGDEELQQKIRKNVFDDWSMVYIMSTVEEYFDSVSAHCFKIYYLYPKMTYEKLKELTKVKDSKRRVVMVKKWLKKNLTKKELETKFNEYYDND